MSNQANSSEAKHTAGPWRLFDVGEGRLAKLCPVSPDLLEALIAAEKALNNIRVCCQHTAWDATGPAVIAARAAIAKATGSAT